MNSPTIVDELKRRLADEKLANKHLNAVLKDLQDELTAAKLKIQELENENR